MKPARSPPRGAVGAPRADDRRVPRADGRGARAWPALGVLLAAGTLGVAALQRLGAAAADRLEWQPALAIVEPWRAFSAAFVHYSGLHLAANLAGVVLTAALGVAARLPPRAALAWLLAWPLTQLGLLAQPALAHYGGLSGVLHAGVAVAATQLALGGDGVAQRRLGVVIAVGLVAKLIGEAPWAGTLAHPSGWDIAVAPGAHVSGVCAGVLAGAAVHAGHRLRTPPRAAGSGPWPTR